MSYTSLLCPIRDGHFRINVVFLLKDKWRTVKASSVDRWSDWNKDLWKYCGRRRRSVNKSWHLVLFMVLADEFGRLIAVVILLLLVKLLHQLLGQRGLCQLVPNALKIQDVQSPLWFNNIQSHHQLTFCLAVRVVGVSTYVVILISGRLLIRYELWRDQSRVSVLEILCDRLAFLNAFVWNFVVIFDRSLLPDISNKLRTSQGRKQVS